MTDTVQMTILNAQTEPEMSYREGRIRMGTPMAMMRPCFQSIDLARVFAGLLWHDTKLSSSDI